MLFRSNPEQLLSLVQAGYKQNLKYFGLWRHEWQGVNVDYTLKEPQNRVYIPSSAEEIEFEIKALRSGLPLLNPGDANPNDGQR